MLGNKTIITLMLLGVCATLVAARSPKGGRGDRGHHRRGLLSEACLVKNLTSDEIEINKTCGCGDITVPCSWGPLTLTTKSGDTIEATFCDMSAYPLPGLLNDACLALSDGTVIRNRTCGKDDPDNDLCSVGPNTFSVAGQQITATFCSRKPKEESRSEDDQELTPIEINDDDKPTCINIERPPRGDRPPKGQRPPRRDRSPRGEGSTGDDDEFADALRIPGGEERRRGFAVRGSNQGATETQADRVREPRDRTTGDDQRRPPRDQATDEDQRRPPRDQATDDQQRRRDSRDGPRESRGGRPGRGGRRGGRRGQPQ